MTRLEMHCPVCGCVNKSVEPQSHCNGCDALLEKPFIDPQGETLFGVDLKQVPMKRMVAAIIRGKSNISKMIFAPFAAWSVVTRRFSRRPWVKPKFKGSVLRYLVISLDDDPGVDKKSLRIVTDSLKKNGFVPALDRLCETYYPGAYQRLFINEARKMYAVASFSSSMATMELIVMTILEGTKSMISASNAMPDFIEDAQGEELLIPGANARTLINALAKAAPLGERKGDSFGLKTLLREIGESHKRLVERSIKEKKLIQVSEQSAMNHNADMGGAPECAQHRGVVAVRLCALCGKALCGECKFPFGGRDYCAGCLPEGADQSGDLSLDFSGEYAPAGFFIRGSIRVAELSIFFWLAWKLFPADSSAASKIVYQSLVIAGFIAYFQTSVALLGATPMQRMAGLAVVDVSGERLSVTSTIVRFGYLLLTLITIVPLLGYLPAIWDKYKRGWHDRMSGAVVVTSNAPIKEKLGAIILGSMIVFGIYNQALVYDFTLKVIYRSLQSLTPPGNISFDSVWSKPAHKNSVFIEGNKVVAIVQGELVAINKLDGKTIWNAKTAGIDMAIGSPETKHYYAIGRQGEMTRLYAIGKKDGKEAWHIELSGKLMGIPLAGRDGVRLIVGRFVTAIDNYGQVIWNQEPAEEPVGIYAAGQKILVEVLEGETEATYVYNQKDGKEIIKLVGLSPAARVGGQKYLLTGEGGSSLFDLSTDEIVWSISQRLSMVDGTVKSGPVLHSLRSARRMSDGRRLYKYPNGCEYTGSFKKVVVLYCKKERTLNIVNANTGAGLAVMKSEPVFSTTFLGEIEEGYILLTLEQIKEGLLNANLYLLEYDNRTVTVFNIGHFRGRPQVEFFKGKGFLFISPSVVGLYKAPWEDREKTN